MNIKKWRKYIIFILFLSVYIFIAYVLDNITSSYVNETFNPFVKILFDYLMYIIFGMILGIEYLLNQKKLEGKWKINLSKLLIMGIPSLFFASHHYITIVGINIFPTILNSMFLILWQILFGYVVVTSFYKDTITRNNEYTKV
ncbi:MAG: hypothetical protein ACOWWH_08590 [Eubacteriaceae bacterium]